MARRRTRQLIGWITLLTLIAIFIGVTGIEVPLPHFGGASSGQAQLAGVRAVAANTLLKVGSGAPAGAELAFMALEPAGNLVVTDSRRHTVMRFDPTGHLLSDWGPSFGQTELTEPAGVAAVSDGYYVIDRGTPRILRLDTSGQLQGIFDLGTLGTYGLNGLAVDSNGNLYAADTGRNRVLVFSPKGQLIKQFGHGGSDLGGFTQPMMLAFGPDGSCFVADWENNRIERWDTTFEATNAWSTGFHAWGIATDQSGRVFVPDADHHRLEVYTPQGATLGEIGAPNAPTIDLTPRQVAVPRSGPPAIYVLGNDAVQRLDLENTAPPPQGGGFDIDLVSLVAIVLMVVLVALAVLSRRQRRGASSLRPSPDRPVRLDAKDGAQRQQEQSQANEELLIANQPKREE